MSEQRTSRCFLACWPNQDLQRRLKTYADRLTPQGNGRAVKSANIHMTLVFLGELTSVRVAQVRQVCQPLPRAFDLELNRLGFWKRKGIIWAGAKETDTGLIEFVETMREDLRRADFDIDSRPFVPHLTLTRKSRRRPQVEFEPMRWLIDEYSLVVSELSQDGARYSVSTRWPTLNQA